MNDAAFVAFLQRVLPRLQLRWSGFRRVRGQVRKRLTRRMRELGLSAPDEYESFLQAHPEEWARLDRMCRITVSRFYRDRGVWGFLRESVMPTLAVGKTLRCWSIGCASGEEPYTIALAWWHDLRTRDPRSTLGVLATDTNDALLERTLEASYPPSSLRDLPAAWREESFEPVGGRFRLLPALRELVEPRRQDIRRAVPDRTFGLILCRNLAFTYFEESLQSEVLDRLLARLDPGGVLVIGAHESLPHTERHLARLQPGEPVFRKPEVSSPRAPA